MAGTPNPLVRFTSGLLWIYRLFRSLILNLLFLFFVLILFSSLAGSPELVVEDDSTLLLEPNGVIVEQLSYTNPFDAVINEAAGANVLGEVLLQDVLDAIRMATEDTRITAMQLNTDKLAGGGFSHLQDIGAALREFRAAGKSIHAVGGNFSQAQYYLASQANDITLNAYGAVGLEGFSAWQNYFGEALGKLGVNVHIFRVGEYKSAVEPFERNDMSPEAKQNYTRLLDDLWGLYVADISNARSLPEGQLQDLIDRYDVHLAQYNGDEAQLALQTKLVDRVDSQVFLTNAEDEGQVDYLAYLRSQRNANFELPSTNTIGIIVASGNIVAGEVPRGNIGDSLAALIRRAASEDDTIKALVLRVDSGGGSAFASELIRAELAAFKASGRPIVVSMGSVAASGGYWIATPADRILASASTITGSIGIFGIYPTFEDGFGKLGIGTDGVGTTELAGYATIGRPLTPLAERSLQLVVENGYDRFLTLVSAARDMEVEAVDAVAQGQVWSGQTAFELGLVDQLGSLADAVAAAAELAGLTDYQERLIEAPLTPAQIFLQQIADNTWLGPLVQPLISPWRTVSPVEKLLAGINDELQGLLDLNDPNALYLQCLECTGLHF